MSRNVSATLKSAAFAQRTDKVFLVLIEIDHDDLSTPIRVVNNTENITSNGNVYQAYPFEINMLSDLKDELPKVTLTIDNVDRQIVQAVRTVSSAPDVTLSVVLADAPNTIEAGPFAMSLKNASYDAFVVSGELGAEDILNEPYPEGTFNPVDFPGLF